MVRAAGRACVLALLAVVATPARADVLPYRPAAPLPVVTYS